MKTIRIGVYALIQYQNALVLIEKKRGPFTGFCDLPGGKIEHGEMHKASLQRELFEELGIYPDQMKIGNLITVEEDFVTHVWEGVQKDEHIIAIVYEVFLVKGALQSEFIESGGDSAGIRCVSCEALKSIPKTPILSKSIQFLRKI